MSRKKPSVRSESVPFFMNNGNEQLSAQDFFRAPVPNDVNKNVNKNVNEAVNGQNNVNCNGGNRVINGVNDNRNDLANALNGIGNVLANFQNQLSNAAGLKNDANEMDESSDDIFNSIGGQKTFKSFNVNAFAAKARENYLGPITSGLINRQKSMNQKLTDSTALKADQFNVKFGGNLRFLLDSLIIGFSRRFAESENGKNVDALRTFMVQLCQVSIEFDQLCMRYPLDTRLEAVRNLGAMFEAKNNDMDMLECVRAAIKEATFGASMLFGWSKARNGNNNGYNTNNNSKGRYGGGTKSGDYVPKGYCIHHHKHNNCNKGAGSCVYKHECPVCKKMHSRKMCPIYNRNGVNSSTPASNSGKEENK